MSLVWIELNGSAPEHNLREIKNGMDGNVLFCAVVKSNGYGHGTAEMVRLLPSADWFAVNALEEGLYLRCLGVKKPVLLMGHVDLDRLDEAVNAGLRLTVYNRETIERLAGTNATVHVKVETGTGRQGVLLDELDDFTRLALHTDGIELEGIFTHFANIEDTLNHEYAEKQLERFEEAVEIVRKAGAKPSVIHTACTAAAILFPRTHFNMVRAGIGLYGLWPSRETLLAARSDERRVPELVPVLTWKTRVAQLKTLPEGSYVGYGCTYRTTRTTRVAVLPVGYADGYDRALGNHAHVLINGRRAPVIGRVCMNITMADVTDIPDIKLENEVVLLGRWDGETISAEDMAGWAHTINYEIVTRISASLDRRIV